MDMFKRELAPLSSEAWAEIENRAKEVLLSRLTARKVVNVNGPKGIDFTAISEGRLTLVDDGDVKAGVYTAKPLTEARIRFSLNKWELDNLARGAKDIDFDTLDAAIEKLALFEERAIYDGYEKGGIKGLKESSEHKALTFGKESSDILASITEGLILLKKSYVHGPYSLIVGKEGWIALNKEAHGQNLLERVERMLGSKVVYSPNIEGALLLPYDSEDLELTIGQDFALGYETHDTKEVTLFATESFTFRVLEPKAIVVYK
ncbi:MAG: family 1 encapsulin nanocompartment shell protein [Sphaerochaeta sp.]|nr:family 1 encapsulin nanocompartment shell protein [Sphaerochaeta sp.]